MIAGAAAGVWAYLALGRGRFWRTGPALPPGRDPRHWPAVAAVVPARDEADVLPRTLPTLIGQRYGGPWRVLVVDDESSDGTGALAAELGAEVHRSAGPPTGWTGKVAAMAVGLRAVGADAEFVLFTDADIAWPPGALQELVRAATAQRLDLTSQLVRLRAETGWERVLIPAFAYFFAQLYPFSRVHMSRRTAAAAGGCMLVRRAALERAGGLAAIRDALIDDVALARAVKSSGGRLWLGHADAIASVRGYPRLSDGWGMVARSAYTQLRHSPLLLAGTVLGLALTYLAPPAALATGIARRDPLTAALGGGAWAVMAATYVPMLRRYGLPSWHASGLPAVAGLYTAMTLDSARRHHAGRGGTWKGRVGGGAVAG